MKNFKYFSDLFFPPFCCKIEENYNEVLSMNKQEAESVERAKAVLNSIYGQKSTVSNITEESDTIKECFSRVAKLVYSDKLNSSDGQELLSKAEEHNIPYDEEDVDWLKLSNDIENYEEVIARAAVYGIDWKNFGYDIMAIEDEINNIEIAESNYTREARKDYYSSRLVRA